MQTLLDLFKILLLVAAFFGFFFVLLPISFPIISALWKKYNLWLRKLDERLDKWAEE